MIGLYLMSQKGWEVLKQVTKAGPPGFIDFVVCEKDSGVQNDYYNEIEALSRESGISFYNRREAAEICAEYSIAISWRWLMADTRNLIVLHDSLLPKYRGFNPLVTALINGDRSIGVTALFANAAFDAGDIIYQSEVSIGYPLKIQQAIDLIAGCYADLVVRICQDIIGGKQLPATPQDELESSYSLWRDDEDYKIEWAECSEKISRFIDAVGYPYKGACSMVEGRSIRILDAESLPDLNIANRIPGKVLFIKDGCPVVVCGEGLLKVTRMIQDNGEEFSLKKFRTRFK